MATRMRPRRKTALSLVSAEPGAQRMPSWNRRPGAGN